MGTGSLLGARIAPGSTPPHSRQNAWPSSFMARQRGHCSVPVLSTSVPTATVARTGGATRWGNSAMGTEVRSGAGEAGVSAGVSVGAVGSGGRGHLRNDQQQMRRRNCHQCGLGVHASSVAWRVQRNPHGSFLANCRWARLRGGVSTAGLFACAAGEATGLSSEVAGLRPIASANSAARCSSVKGGTSR